MISVEEASARILATFTPVGAETVALAEAAGRISAAPVIARTTQPPADVSAMDGFAVRAEEARGGAALRLIGSAPAGHPFAGSVGAGETVRIFTGSFIPAGADAVLLQEDADAEEGGVRVRETVRPGQHIRRQGQDFAAGEAVIAAGRRLSSRDIGLAAAADHPWLLVHRRPRVAVLATGDEIALPGEPIPPGGIVSSNAHALAAMVAALGGAPSVLPIAADDTEAIGRAADAARGFDLLLTTGGISVGAHDLVQEGLARRGLAVDFWKIAMRPGKPLMFGRLGEMPVLGLPGNPVAAFVCALLFARPALLRLAGLAAAPLPTTTAETATALGANDRRFDFLRARLEEDAAGRLVATAFAVQDSAMQAVLARADALILRPPHAPAVAAGAAVEIVRFDRLGL
jgi:molybdopterin molybdotransferase